MKDPFPFFLKFIDDLDYWPINKILYQLSDNGLYTVSEIINELKLRIIRTRLTKAPDLDRRKHPKGLNSL